MGACSFALKILFDTGTEHFSLLILAISVKGRPACVPICSKGFAAGSALGKANFFYKKFTNCRAHFAFWRCVIKREKNGPHGRSQ